MRPGMPSFSCCCAKENNFLLTATQLQFDFFPVTTHRVVLGEKKPHRCERKRGEHNFQLMNSDKKQQQRWKT